MKALIERLNASIKAAKADYDRANTVENDRDEAGFNHGYMLGLKAAKRIVKSQSR